MTIDELNKIKKEYKVIDIAVDFINPSYNISRAKHLDNARYIVCTLTENGVPRNVKSNEVARIRLQKPDKQPVYNDCDVIEDGRVLITLTEQILAVEGNAVCDIQLTNEETGIIYSTKNFIINIDKTAVDNSVIESSYEFDALNNLISSNKKLKDWFEEKIDEHYFVLTEDKDVAGGVPSLDENGKIPRKQMPEGYANQNAFGFIKVIDSKETSSVTLKAEQEQSLFTLKAGDNVTLTGSTGTSNYNVIKIDAKDTTYKFNTPYNATHNKAATMSDISDSIDTYDSSIITNDDIDAIFNEDI